MLTCNDSICVFVRVEGCARVCVCVYFVYSVCTCVQYYITTFFTNQYNDRKMNTKENNIAKEVPADRNIYINVIYS